MDNLNEEIDLMLEHSLEESYPHSASQFSGYLTQADREKRASRAAEKAARKASEKASKEKQGKIRAFANSPKMQALEAALDGLSLIPAINVPTAGASAIINVVQGDYGEAVLSLAAMIPLGAVASKAGKFGPYILKLAPVLKNTHRLKATGGIRGAIENALKLAGSDADFDDALEATRKFVKLYDKARRLPGLDSLDELAGDWVDPLRKAIETLDTEAPAHAEWADVREAQQALNEDKLAPIIIDFNQLRKKELNESFLAMFGGWVERILSAMFGDLKIPVSVRGNEREVKSFARAIGGEKSYIEAARRYGLDHPTTYKSRVKLDNAVKGFEKDTGLKWPFK